MADVVEINFAALQHSSASLAAKAKALTSQLEQLHQNLQPITATWCWPGRHPRFLWRRERLHAGPCSVGSHARRGLAF